jgi:hypothetical protein
MFENSSCMVMISGEKVGPEIILFRYSVKNSPDLRLGKTIVKSAIF